MTTTPPAPTRASGMVQSGGDSPTTEPSRTRAAAPAAALHGTSAWSETGGRLAGPVLVMLLLAMWEAGVRLAGIQPWILPTPSDVAAALVRDAGWLGDAAVVTLAEAAGGLVLGSLIGLAAAVAITFAPRLEQAILSLALLAKSTPVIAVAPILTIWLGFGHAPKVLVTALLTFFPMLVNALEGFRSADPAILDWMRSVNAGPAVTFRRVRWPSAQPHVFAALKVSTPLAMIGAVVAEWMGASEGLGRAMWLAYTNLRMPELFAAVVVLTVLSAIVYALVARWEHRVVHWRSAGGARR